MTIRLLVVASLVVAAAVAPAAVAAPKPALALVSSQPLVVRGTGFHAGESVTVTALTPIGPRIVRLKTGPRGGFRVTFRLPAQPCATPFAVRARGASGQVATIWFDTAPCTPPPVD